MTSLTTSSTSPWRKLRAPFAVSTVAVLLGAAVVAPMTLPSAEADVDPALMNERLYQEFVPNADPMNDLILPEIPIEKLPDPKPEPAPEKTAAAAAPAAPAAAPRYTGGGSPAEWMAAAGIAESDWGYVDYIVSRESTWNPNAINPAGGYCGLVQIAPLHGVQNCTDPVVNLRWASSYAIGRYGSWEGAYNHWATYQSGW